MIEVHATLVDTFASGRWWSCASPRLARCRYSTKEGLVEASYAAGDAILVGQADNIVCEPISREGAFELAARILDNDLRARTDPLALLALATAVAGFLVDAPSESIEMASALPVPAGAELAAQDAM